MNVPAWLPGTRAWRHRRDMALCRQTGARIQEIVDGELPADAAGEKLRAHLDACRRCQGEAEVIEQLKNAIAQVGAEVDPDTIGSLEDLCLRLCDEPVDE